jgi:hypothetical protein
VNQSLFAHSACSQEAAMHTDPPHASGVSRRDFLRTGALSAAALPAIAAGSAHAAASTKSAPTSFAASTDLLATARSTAQWIDSARRQDAQGVWWLPDPDHPEHETTVAASTWSLLSASRAISQATPTTSMAKAPAGIRPGRA